MKSTQDIIYEGADFSLVYQPVSDFGMPVVAKQLSAKKDDAILRFQLKNEWELTHSLTIKGIRKALELDPASDTKTLYLEYVEGASLREFFLNRSWSLSEIVQTSVQVARILGNIHAAGIIHKDINPRNILINSSSKEPVLIDFGIATRLNVKSDFSTSPDKLEGSLAYMSPEQTGRMNRLVDSRTDLYSFGVTLYELLTRVLPFNATNAAELVYCHIARNPVPPSELNSQVPVVLSNIVMKLLEKNVEQRYQSAAGLRYDLEKVLQMLKQQTAVSSFALGANDISSRFRIPQKLYGREAEVEQLLSCFKRVTAGESMTAFVTGFSGVGKSVLIHEIYRPVTEYKGFFIEGKFDQYHQNIPYQAFILAFRNFVQQLLGAGEQQMNAWRAIFRQSLADNGGVITSLIPELEFIIGKQEAPAPLGPIESQNRFNFTFIRFIKDLATADHPLVLFLDDLQFTDLASLNLLSALTSDSTLSYFYFIGAYRDNEVNSQHPLYNVLYDLKNRQNANLFYIHLSSLQEESVNHLISDTLHADPQETRHLSSIINKKTDSNPYFINEFLKSLYEDELITWNGEKMKWNWNEPDIEKRSVTENVVQFLTRRINAFPKETLAIMKTASCIGNTFSAGLLQGVIKQAPHIIYTQLEMMVGQGYLFPVGSKEIIEETGQPYSVFPSYKFIHDRFQQAIYSLVSEKERADIHLVIGQHLVPEYEKGTAEIFEVVNHLNEAQQLVTEAEQKWQLCKLNYEAGSKANGASAWNASARYYALAMSLLAVNGWEQEYDFTFRLTLARAQSEFLIGNISGAEQLMDSLLAKAHSNYEKALVLSQKIVLYGVINKQKEAIDMSRQCLTLLNVKMPHTTAGIRIGILSGLTKTALKLRKKKPSYLLTLPQNTSKEGRLLFKVISDSTTPAFYYNREYFMLLQLIATNYSIDKGNTDYSAFAYACYAIVQIALFKNYKYAYEFCDVLFTLNDTYYNSLVRGRMLSPIVNGIFPWMKPLADTIPYQQEGIANAMKSGDPWFTGSNQVNLMQLMLRTGKNLLAVRDEFSDFGLYVEKQNNIFLSSEYNLYVFWIKAMSAKVSKGDFAEFEEKYCRENKSNEAALGYFYGYACRYFYLFYNYPEAGLYAEKIRRLFSQLAATPVEADAKFYYALSIVRASAAEDKKSIAIIQKTLSLFEVWEKNCPQNFTLYCHILRGEYRRLNNDVSGALACFRDAITASDDSGFIYLEALANDLAGLLCADYKFAYEAQRYLQKAATLYLRWGASAKAKAMKKRFPDIDISDATSRSTKIQAPADIGTSRSSHSMNENLDLETVMRASAALSGEVKFEQLLKTMVTIMMENAGAQKSILFLEKRKEMLPKVLQFPGDGNMRLLFDIPKEESDDLPVSLIQYVYRTREEMVFDEAADDFRFVKDAYFRKYKPHSVLCMPISQYGELVGILYLENKALSGVFNAERVQLIRLLSGQIAVSIENSLAYETLEQKVTDRTDEINKQRLEIEREKQKSDGLLLSILPKETADELKMFGKAQPRRYESVSVMFADFVNFTRLSEQLSADELVEQINYYYSAFDAIMLRNKLEKIKTIGDSYMCVGGLPEENSTHAENIMQAALDMKDFINKTAEERTGNGMPWLDCRIGIHTGPLVAGVVGTTKFAYDVWGDTVNTAARMQQCSEPGRINISGATFSLLSGSHYKCHYRGKIEAKHKGLVDMYFVDKTLPASGFDI